MKKTQPIMPRIVVSFSGGKTSAFLLERVLETFSKTHNIVVVFANTGQEHEKTLLYVRNISNHYGVATIWVEAVFDMRKGKGTRHRVVSFATASRNGEPFEQMCQKHGLPNSQFPHCTRDLKQYAIRSYLKSLGWRVGTYKMAIGIRADETDRMSPAAAQHGFIYPLIGLGTTKADVLAWETQHPVRLGIPEHLGNCTWCWKKSLRKLATVVREEPHRFDFPRKLEQAYKDHGAGFGDRRMFRGRLSVNDIFSEAAKPDFVPFTDPHQWNERLDVGAACGESCEIGADT